VRVLLAVACAVALTACQKPAEVPVSVAVAPAPAVVPVSVPAPSKAVGTVPTKALQYRSMLVREGQFVFGLDAPIAAMAGQIHQESGWRADVTAYDDGRGLAQFMDATAAMVSKAFPDLGAPDPYNPRWAIRALARYDSWLLARVHGKNECEKWGAALKGYNGGIGYVNRAEKQSSNPGLWFNVTEWINAGQGAKNFEYSRTYPHKVLFKHQPIYADWGRMVCDGVKP